MPVYEYECQKCDKSTDVQKSVKDFDRPERCGGCGDEMKRMPPRLTSFELKGHGWYNTDYKIKR